LALSSSWGCPIRGADIPEEPASATARVPANYDRQAARAGFFHLGFEFPNEYSSLLQTTANATSTIYGGSAKLSYLTLDPRLVILFAGFSFSMDYNQPRGHQDTLIDVQATKRVTATRTPPAIPANPRIIHSVGADGMTAYDSKLFSDMTPASPNPSAAPTATKPAACAWSSPTRPWTPPSSRRH